MLSRIVEIADDHRHLSLFRGFMVVEDTQQERGTPARELGRVPLDDIAAVITHANDITYTNNLLVALAQQGSPFVFCAANHNPVGVLWSVDGHSLQAKRFDAQITAGKPTHKRLWAALVKAKLQQQAAVLEVTGAPSIPLSALAKTVRAGDPDNKEAQGAQRYWPLLFGKTFRRNASAGGLNVLLNYGYTVQRAAMARAIIAAGLHPTLGIFHRNEGNSMRLVDDLMEPFRPLVDFKVWQLWQNNPEPELTPEIKRTLVRVLYHDMGSGFGATPVYIAMQRLATSLAQVYLKERDQLELPYPQLPMELMGE